MCFSSGSSLYNKLKRYILKEEELRDNCFPRSMEDKPGTAVFYATQRGTSSKKGMFFSIAFTEAFLFYNTETYALENI